MQYEHCQFRGYGDGNVVLAIALEIRLRKLSIYQLPLLFSLPRYPKNIHVYIHFDGREHCKRMNHHVEREA